MARFGRGHEDVINPLGAPHVTGLEPGRERARRQQRRRRLRNSVTSGLGVALTLAVVVAAAYVGYAIYDEQQTTERRESDLRRAELDDPDVRDVIDDLEVQPKWNGPGTPSFGVGEDPADG